MIRSYLIITTRKLYRHKLYTLINILGLALGIACFALLFTMVLHELNYDHFHPLADRTFRITEMIERRGVGERAASVPFPVATSLQKEFPGQIEKTVRLFNFQYPSLVIEYEHHKYHEKKFFFADASFFGVFGFPLVAGDAKTVLSKPNTVVLTASAAERYFGEENPLGKTIFFQGTIPLIVTGVVRDMPLQSHIHFEFIASFSTLDRHPVSASFNTWIWNPCWTYLVLKPGVQAAELENLLPEFVKKYFDEDLKEKVEMHLQPLTRIHLHSDLDYEIGANGDIRYIYIFSVISVFVLIIAAINFMNLSTARSSLRAKEVVVRKMMGADRRELMTQFLLESMLLSGFAILFAFIIVEVTTPYLSDLSGNKLHRGIVHTPGMIAIVLTAGVSVGILSGIYPAYYLSSFDPTKVFHGKIVVRDGSKWFRRVMVVIQFVISTFLLITTSFSFKQLHYLRNTQLGFDKEHLLMIPVADGQILKHYEKVKAQLLLSGAVASLTYVEEVMGKTHQTHEYHPEGVPPEQLSVYPALKVGYDFIKTFNIKILAGRDFLDSQQVRSDFLPHFGIRRNFAEISPDEKHGAVIINEAMVKHLGWNSADSAIGRRFNSNGGDERVVGVVEDFHFSSLHNSVTPFVIDLARKEDLASTIKYLAVKVEKKHMDDIIPAISGVWEEFLPSVPLDYFFLEEKLDKLYLKEQKLGEISALFSIVAISIACMGLFGLASFVVEQRQKEIGIRKALGATNLEITFMLSQKFLVIVSISVLIAWTLSYIVLNEWLHTFPYHIALSAGVFLRVGGLVLFITLVTVSYHTVRAAIRQPIDSIRSK